MLATRTKAHEEEMANSHQETGLSASTVTHDDELASNFGHGWTCGDDSVGRPSTDERLDDLTRKHDDLGCGRTEDATTTEEGAEKV